MFQWWAYIYVALAFRHITSFHSMLLLDYLNWNHNIVIALVCFLQWKCQLGIISDYLTNLGSTNICDESYSQLFRGWKEIKYSCNISCLGQVNRSCIIRYGLAIDILIIGSYGKQTEVCEYFLFNEKKITVQERITKEEYIKNEGFSSISRTLAIWI